MMKKTLIIISAGLISLLSCTKEKETIDPAINNSGVSNDVNLNLSITQDQNATMFFYTSTGCPGCGSWGAPTFKNLIYTQNPNVTPIAVHIKYNDPYITETSEAIANNRTGQFYTPQIHVGNKNIVILETGAINGNASVQQAKDSVSSTSSKAPLASCGSIYQVNNSTLTVKYGVEFHQQITGELYVAAYILEDGIISSQAGISLLAEHNDVIRLSADGNHFGSLIKNGTINVGENYENQVTIPIDSKWNVSNLKIATVLWEKVGGEYIVSNSSVFKL